MDDDGVQVVGAKKRYSHSCNEKASGLIPATIVFDRARHFSENSDPTWSETRRCSFSTKAVLTVESMLRASNWQTTHQGTLERQVSSRPVRAQHTSAACVSLGVPILLLLLAL